MKKDTICLGCGQLMYRKPGSSLRMLCMKCRQADPIHVKTPSVTEWICGGCGAKCSRPPTKGQRPKWCRECQVSMNTIPIRVSVRMRVYERDGWICGICLGPVDRTLIGSADLWRPSIDHVKPVVNGGDEDESNLRLAHMLCNTLRADERNYSGEKLLVKILVG